MYIIKNTAKIPMAIFIISAKNAKAFTPPSAYAENAKAIKRQVDIIFFIVSFLITANGSAINCAGLKSVMFSICA